MATFYRNTLISLRSVRPNEFLRRPNLGNPVSEEAYSRQLSEK